MNDCKNSFLVFVSSCIIVCASACVSQNVRSGLCPIPTGPGICADYCNKDGDCPGAEKCCSNGCGHVCMNPLSAIPSFHGTPSNKTVKETEDVILTCYASSPDTKITWFKDGKTVTGSNFAFFRGRLLILRVKREDKGWYVCKATNRAGTKAARAYLQVLPSLDAVGPIVRCPDPGAPANGNRHPSPEEGSDYPQGSVIRYTCFPHYELHGPVTRTCLGSGRWNDKAPECLSPPRFQHIPTNKTIKETGGIMLRCSVSTPDTNITWFKDGKVVKGDNNVFLSRNGLWLQKAHREDQGWYVCNATNMGGSGVAYAYLKVVVPLDADCGKPTLATRQRIVGGEKVEAGSFPWQVSLWNTRSDKHFCGGSLVAARWVVTAAHCLAGISVGDIQVRLGKIYTNKAERGREQLMIPDRIIIHPHFDHRRNDYDRDVALIHLSSSAVYTDYVRPICLPLKQTDADKFLLRTGNTGVSTGWGGKRHHGRTAKRMLQVTVPVVDQATCKKSHKKYLVTDNMFCAGLFNGTLGGACQGDSGGPLAIDNSLTPSDDDVRWVLAGIISWGDGCGRIGKYGVYTRVSKFTGWINTHINADD